MDHSGSPRAAAGVRFVTEPDGTVTAEHVESGATGAGETAVDALATLYGTNPDLDPPANAGFAGGDNGDDGEDSEDWEWVGTSTIEPAVEERGDRPDTGPHER